MNFKDTLKTNPQEHRKSGKKVAIRRLKQILAEQMAYVQENNSFTMQEKTEQMTVFFRVTKILSSYDELEPVLTDFFRKKAEKEKFER